jgi:UDP-3-O-[3-hydroxymyristoyl] glucosamine N-acyltransferase
MKFKDKQKLEDIAAIINCDFVGSAHFPVLGMNEIHVVTPGDIVFVDHPKYYDKALESAATIILINKKIACPADKALLISDDPFRDFNKLGRYFCLDYAFAKADTRLAQIGNDCQVHPTASLGKDVVIGDSCIIHAHVSIGDRCIVGNNVIINANTVLGGDAFYFKRRPEGYDKLISIGRVIIEDHVELGASCTIDRGVTGDTTIGYGSKLDTQVHIGHDSVIGKHVLIASQTAVAGCVIVEDEVTLWGQVGITSGVTIGAKAVLLAKSGVSKSLEGNKKYFGAPAEEFRTKYKEMAALKSLPKLLHLFKMKSSDEPAGDA